VTSAGGSRSANVNPSHAWTLASAVEWCAAAVNIKAGGVTSGDAVAAGSASVLGVKAVPTAAVTGTAVGGITEADVVAGGKVITLTLTGDTFIAN